MPATSKSIQHPTIELNKKYLDFIQLIFFYLINLLQNSGKPAPLPRPEEPDVIPVKTGIRFNRTGIPCLDRFEDKPSRNGTKRFLTNI
jgi:hypothetical protein